MTTMNTSSHGHTHQLPSEMRDQIDMEALKSGRPLLWAPSRSRTPPSTELISATDAGAAEARFRRFAPLLQTLFPEVAAAGGNIESPLIRAGGLRQALGLASDQGALFVKGDHALPIAGSIKARGGMHEVLEYAEALAMKHGLLAAGGSYASLAGDAARALFARHTISVGSTGNLGLAIGVMAAGLGFQAEVHMSADAKDWKKERLRTRGVKVIEHAGDYAQAVAAGRASALADPSGHFVDDERSLSLFLGYTAAAPEFARQLAAAGRTVDAAHPLFVYLPCGVGGAPGGIAYGLSRIYGDHVHCFFAEPTASPSFLVRLLAGTPALPHLGPAASVYDLGLDNRTEADGLAVPQASELAVGIVGPLVGGAYTVCDQELFRHLYLVFATEGLRIEPSAAAGLSGPRMLLDTPQGQHYLRSHGLQAHLERATHVAWTTGGLFVPDGEFEHFVARGKALHSDMRPLSPVKEAP